VVQVAVAAVAAEAAPEVSVPQAALAMAVSVS
jgi:hypothetical protein